MEAVRGRGIPRRYYGTLRTLGRLRGQAGAATGEDRHIRRPHRAWWRGARTRREGSEQSSALRERPPVECMQAGLDACKAGLDACKAGKAGLDACKAGWARARCMQARLHRRRGRVWQGGAAICSWRSSHQPLPLTWTTISDAIRRNQTQSDAIRRNQTQSDAIRPLTWTAGSRTRLK